MSIIGNHRVEDDSLDLNTSSISHDIKLLQGINSTKDSFRDFYSVNPPFGYVGIEINSETGQLKYRVIEPTIEEDERWMLKELKDVLIARAHAVL